MVWEKLTNRNLSRMRIYILPVFTGKIWKNTILKAPLMFNESN